MPAQGPLQAVRHDRVEDAQGGKGLTWFLRTQSQDPISKVRGKNTASWRCAWCSKTRKSQRSPLVIYFCDWASTRLSLLVISKSSQICR